jgi:hypothetical protein
VVSQLRTTLAESNRNSDLLAVPHDLDADQARKWRDHPAQFWLERAIVNGLAARGGSATQDGSPGGALGGWQRDAAGVLRRPRGRTKTRRLNG